MRRSQVLLPVAALPLLVACGGASAPPPAAPASAPVAPTAPVAATPAPSGAPAKAKEPAPAPEPEPEVVVELSFEPLVVGVRPGGRFLLAARLRMAPGYRVWWKHTPDVGKPTVITFRAPPGFEVGPVQLPAPTRFTMPGGFVGFGYERETAVFAEVTAPPSVRGDGVHRFDVDASWVACKKECRSERTSAFVELVTSRGPSAAEDVVKELAPYRARLPLPLSALTGSEQVWEGPVLTVKLPGAVPEDFFTDGTASPRPTRTAMADGELRFTYDEPPRPGSAPLRGVIAAKVGGAPAFYDLVASLPGETPPAPAAPPPPPPKKGVPASGKRGARR